RPRGRHFRRHGRRAGREESPQESLLRRGAGGFRRLGPRRRERRGDPPVAHRRDEQGAHAAGPARHARAPPGGEGRAREPRIDRAGVAAQMEMARQAVLVRALFEDEVKKNPITDAQLEQQYTQFKGSMGTNEYKVRHILVDKEEDAKAIIAELNKGGDFAKIAKEKSKDPGSKDNGGDLDWGPSARYVKPFADAVTSMQKGQTTSAPVKTDFGYHVIRLDDVRPLTVPPFAELKEQFRQRAQQQQIQKLVMDLRSKAKIEER